MRSQTKNSSYKKMFSLIEESEDFYEVQIIERIKDDYDRFHKHDFVMFEKMKSTDNIQCPRCGSTKFISHGKDKNGSKRYKCKDCGKTFNVVSNSLFFSSKVNIKAWFAFLESLLSGTSMRAACIVSKISTVTGSEWMDKIFTTLKCYQDEIILNKEVYIDETYVHEDKSKIYHLEEIGKIKKVKKEPRGISRNKICILVATDKDKSFGEIVCHGRPKREINYQICKKHIQKNSTVIGDEDTSLTYTSKLMNWDRIQVKSYTEEAFEKLSPIDEVCNRFKFFINKHRGFKKDLLQDYINLFFFIYNEIHKENDIYKVTVNLLKRMFDIKIK